MRIIEEHFIENFSDLKDLCWSGALDTLEDIENANKEDELMEYLEEVFSNTEDNTDTALNDYVWFARDEIYDYCGLDENGKLIEDEDTRHCTECGKEMHEGYCIENGLEYYCSDECLHKHYTDDEYNEMYDNGNGDSYYTTWED